jgi:hypothetical protein
VTKHLELCTKNKASCLQHVIGPETDLWEVGRGGGLALGNALFENHAILNRAENHWTMQPNQGHGSALNDFVIGTQIRQRDVSWVGPVLSAFWK